jgi:hypothetical protein
MRYIFKRFLILSCFGFVICTFNGFIFADGTNIKNGGLDLKNIQDAPEEICADS